MFGQPSLPPSQDGTDAQGKALLGQERVSSVTTAVGHHLVVVRDVRDDRPFRIAGPVVYQRLCGTEHTKSFTVYTRVS